MNYLTIKETLTAAALNKALEYLDKDPDTNIPKLLDLTGIQQLHSYSFFCGSHI